MRELRSELTRLNRKGIWFGWLGLIAVFAVLINSVIYTIASNGSAPPGGGPGVAFPSVATLESSAGIVAGVSSAASMFGVITLSFWAIATASDYSTGLIRLLVAAQPHRLRLLLGKLGALLLWTAIATTVGVVVNLIAAVPSAQAAGISTAHWMDDAVGQIARGWVNSFSASVVWGIIGLVLAVITRSAAISISVGVGWVLLIETIIKTASSDAGKWLPGTTLTALAQGGTAELSFANALLTGAIYAVIGLGIGIVVFVRRPITE
jgi:ABC-type transport system involved in multi-copper enzyme maturation permease subunit